MEYLSILK